MFIAHLPAAYLLNKLCFKIRWVDPATLGRFAQGIGCLGGILPDFDLLYFYLIDERAHRHHTYFTHFPLFWLTLLLGFVYWRRRASKTSPPSSGKPWLVTLANGGVLITSNALLHMVLDTMAGGIQWLSPFIATGFSFVQITPHYPIWWLNYLLHWTFWLEVAICGLALSVWIYATYFEARSSHSLH
jgi:inner membrane protein